VAIAPLLWLTEGASVRRGAVLGLAFGLVFFGILIYWISIVGFAAFFLLVLLQATLVGAFGAAWAFASRRTSGVGRILVPAALWVLFVEVGRALVPVFAFTWGQLAQSQHDAFFVLRWAGVGGSWLVAFIVVAANALVLALVREPVLVRRLAFGGGAVALALSGFLLPQRRATGTEADLAIVQGNIPRYMEASYEKDRIILSSHAHLSDEVADHADLVIWPESSVGIDPFRDESVGAEITAVADESGTPMIVGGNRDIDEQRYAVMAYLVRPGEGFAERYQKTHLVPFGEYVPARRYLDWLPILAQVPRDAVHGEDIVVFDVAGGKVATAISFEADFGSLVRSRIAAGARLLVVATNTSTWEDTWASRQHVALSQVRAAENGVFVAHGALTGISAFIDPEGRVLQDSELWQHDVLTQRVRFAESITLYARYGDWFPWTLLVAVAAWRLLLARKRPGSVPS
jgi:apolipoprotein N-acyltransferase